MVLDFMRPIYSAPEQRDLSKEEAGVGVWYGWGTGLPAMALMQAVQRLSCVSSLVTSPFSNKWFSRSALINFTVKCQGEDKF